jgi:hypothetical protein
VNRAEVVNLIKSELTGRLPLLIQQLQAVEQPVSGGVDAAGAPTDGTGFTATQNALGDYTVTFDTPFSDAPAVVCEPDGGTATKTRVYGRSATGFSVETFINSAGVDANADSSFSFFARYG